MSRPALFAELSFADARAKSTELQSWLLVDFTAEWCQPCKHMDRTTWVDPSMEAWVRTNGLAVQVDGDASSLAQDLGVLAYPTVIAFHAGVEVDRVSGARPAKALITWLDALKEGRTELDALRQTPKHDVSGQLQLAVALVERKLDDEALEVFVWLWEHSLEHNPHWVGVRASYLLNALKPLLERSPAARARFSTLRDAAGVGTSSEAFADFVRLNATLDEELKTVEWLERVDPARGAELWVDAAHDVIDVVEKHGAWAAFGRLVREPSRLLDERRAATEELRAADPDDFPPDMYESTIAYFAEAERTLARVLLRSLRAAARTAEASAFEAHARHVDSSPEMAAALGLVNEAD